MKTFREFLFESVKSDAIQIFDRGPGGIKKQLEWRDDKRSATFTTKSGSKATIMFRGQSSFVVYDNTKTPPNNKLVDSTADPAPLESLWTVVWGVD